jgi:hypothetical protein
VVVISSVGTIAVAYIIGKSMRLVGIAASSNLLATVYSAIEERDRSTQKLQDQTAEVKSFLQGSKLPKDIKRRIRNYYQYSWKQIRAEEENDILEGLPGFLRGEVVAYLYQDLIEQVNFFRTMGETCSSMAVLKLERSCIEAVG